MYILYAGTVNEGPSNVTYIPGVTPLPIELTCNVAEIPIWIVNDTSYTTGELANGVLPGHSRIGSNILVNSPVNNTEYICVSLRNDGGVPVSSDPVYIIIIIAGEWYVHMLFTYSVYNLLVPFPPIMINCMNCHVRIHTIHVHVTIYVYIWLLHCMRMYMNCLCIYMHLLSYYIIL